MGDVLIPLLDTLLVVVLLTLVALFVVLVRREVLSRRTGTFACSRRRGGQTDQPLWSPGLARYEDDRLDWFRFFAVLPWAHRSFERHRLMIVDTRKPDEHEAYSLGEDWVVVRCDYGGRPVELAMSDGNFNGLAAWVESAPPGRHMGSVA